MKNKINKAIFIDMDGTLFTSKKEISATNLSALEKARRAGYLVVICTGRSLARVLTYNIRDIDYIIFSNGSGIYDCKVQKAIHENFMRPESVEKVRAIALKYSLELLVQEHENGVVQMIPLCPDYDLMRKITSEFKSIPHICVPNQSKALTDPNMPIDYTHDGGCAFIDINDENSSKGNGILKFSELFNIKKEDRIAIGDDMNDFSMFEVCGYNVAMGNAIKGLKSRADYITDTNDNDGVAKFIARL